jgi:chaperonin GroEL (HSP60 family)
MNPTGELPMMQGQQVYILKEGTQREQGKGAHKNNIEAAIAIANTVRSTLGPKGMDKMMVDTMGDVVITNDGVTILKEMDIEHPAAKMMVEIAKTQDAESGDGTTTAVVLAGELLKQAGELIERSIHPTTITAGYKLASEKALKLLDEMAEKVDRKDIKKLQMVASTSMMSKSVVGIRDMMAELAVKAVLSIAEDRNGKVKANIDNILIVKKHGGSTRDTQLIDGLVLDKEVVHATYQGRQDSPAGRGARDQEDRGRRQDNHRRPGQAPGIPCRGGGDPEGSRRICQGIGGECRGVPEGHR